MSASHLLVIWDSRTGASEQLARAAYGGARAGDLLARAEEVAPDDLLAAGGYLFACPENLASMSGAMKEMFDRCYYPVLGRIEGRPYATIVAAGSDGQGAQRQIDRIAKGWRLKRVAEPWIVDMAAQDAVSIQAMKTVAAPDLARARDLGAALAQGLELGIF